MFVMGRQGYRRRTRRRRMFEGHGAFMEGKHTRIKSVDFGEFA